MMFTVYVLYSAKYDKIYIGYSSGIEERLKSHNELSQKGWTIRFRPWRLVYKEEYPGKKEAMLREKQLKTAAGRRWIRETLL